MNGVDLGVDVSVQDWTGLRVHTFACRGDDEDNQRFAKCAERSLHRSRCMPVGLTGVPGHDHVPTVAFTIIRKAATHGASARSSGVCLTGQTKEFVGQSLGQAVKTRSQDPLLCF